jgi:hypothetical protein
MELNLHWSLMEKLPKLERGGEIIGEAYLGWGKTIHRGSLPRMGKDDSEA